MSDSLFPLSLRDVKRTFVQGDRRLEVLRGVSLDLRPGEIVALVGQSGSGKSTLLHIAGLLERPDEGDLIVEGKSAGAAGDRERTTLRRKVLGFVYQYHHLLPEFSAIENVMLPQMLNGRSRGQARAHAAELLAMVQLKDRSDHRPGRLSGGEQQRVAIARAVANAPRVLLADEPTGNLDASTADTVFRQLLSLVRDTGMAALVATHNPEQVFYFDSTGLQRRMDYVTEVLGSTLVGHYSSQYRSFDGLLVATRRRIFRRNPDNTVNLNQPSITLDIRNVELSYANEQARP